MSTFDAPKIDCHVHVLAPARRSRRTLMWDTPRHLFGFGA